MPKEQDGSQQAGLLGSLGRGRRAVRVAEIPAQEHSPQMHGGLIDNIATYLALDVPQEPTNTRIENAEDMLSLGTGPRWCISPRPPTRRLTSRTARW